jgi:hypothetical protein
MLNLFVSHVFTDTGIEFVKYSELDFRFFIDFDVLGGLDGALESRGDDGEVLALLRIGDKLLHDFGQDLGVFHSSLAQVGITADPVIEVELRFPMSR